MFRKFEAFYGDIQCRRISAPGVLPPPLDHFHALGLFPHPGRGAVELEAELTVHVQDPVCSHKLWETEVGLG